MSETPLRKLRRKRELTLYTVATAVGLDTGNLSRIERMQQQAGPKTAERLAVYFERAITEEQILYPERFINHVPADLADRDQVCAGGGDR